MAPLWRARRSEADKATAKVPPVPDEVVSAASLGRREQVLAGARDDHTGGWVLVTTWRLVLVDTSGGVGMERAWLEVDAGAWDPDTATLSVTWVGGGRGQQWQLRSRTGPGRVPEAFRERVSASVVLARHLDLGERRSARVVIRKALDSRELVEQVLLGRHTRPDDPEVAAEVGRARAEVRDQVGLPPVAGRGG